MPTHHELIGYGRSIEEIRQWIGVDHLFYLSVKELIQAVRREAPHLISFDTSVFDGKYVTGGVDQQYFEALLLKRNNMESPVLQRLGSVDMHNQE
jgi:amidophosphoribosyltransferase